MQKPDCDTLDPDDWPAFRAQSHRMLDDMLDYVEWIRQRPVWQAIPADTRARFQEPLPRAAGDLAAAHHTFMNDVLPFAVGNVHPGFMGWVHGAGTPVGMVAEMLAAGLNANVGGRNQMPVEVERQIVRWMRELFGFPETASGLFVTGTSMANLMGLLVARTAVLGKDVRRAGVALQAADGHGGALVAYTSAAAHGCIAQAMDLSGLGTAALRVIGVDAGHRIDVAALRSTIAADRGAGLRPFFVVGTAGSVDIGAVDDLTALADLAREEQLWFHVDGAYGALGMLAPTVAPLLAGIERADSIAFDFHKWGQVPYDAGFLLVRDAARHIDTFAAPAAYLRREVRGLAAGSPWPCDFGPDLSRGFRALKTWFTLKVHGADRIGQAIAQTCVLARYLASRVAELAPLELMAPVALNIVCFRYRAPADGSVSANLLNRDIVADLHESGIAAPSTTTLNGQLVIRAAIVNHRTSGTDIDTLLAAVLSLGAARCAAAGAAGPTADANPAATMSDLIDTASVPYAPLIGVAPLMRLAFQQQDLGPLGAALLARAQHQPDDANAYLDCSTVLQLTGERGLALAVQAQALDICSHYTLPARRPAAGPGLTLLVIMGPGDLMANTPVEFLVEQSDVTLELLYLRADGDWPDVVPEHDVLLVALAESDVNQPLLRRLAGFVTGWPRPVINRPEQIAVLTRDGVCAALAGLPGVDMPVTTRVARATLQQVAATTLAPGALLPGDDFPLIVRPIGSHAGTDLERMATPADLQAYLAKVDVERFYLSRFVDYRSADGQFRKYRVALIAGRPFLCHLAVSSHWMVHYLNAGMNDSAVKRDEEAAVMASFDDGFALRHAAALAAIDARMGLPYLGIDCAETPDGRLLIFEVDNAMIVHAIDPVDRYPYKQPAMQKVFDAFRRLLEQARGSTAPD